VSSSTHSLGVEGAVRESPSKVQEMAQMTRDLKKGATTKKQTTTTQKHKRKYELMTSQL
jgi:hypothetical protein